MFDAELGKPKPEMFDAFAEAMEVQYPDRLDLDNRGSSATPAVR